MSRVHPYELAALDALGFAASEHQLKRAAADNAGHTVHARHHTAEQNRMTEALEQMTRRLGIERIEQARRRRSSRLLAERTPIQTIDKD